MRCSRPSRTSSSWTATPARTWRRSVRRGRSLRFIASWTSPSTRTSSTRTSIPRRRNLNAVACRCSQISGTLRARLPRWVARPSDRRKRACSAEWPPNGAGGPSDAPRESRSTLPTWCAVRYRWSGTSSPGTGTSKCARFRWLPAGTAMDVEQMLERVDENTIMVVPTFGVTYTGSYEPVLELSDALDQLQAGEGVGRRHPRRRSERSLSRSVLRTRHQVGFPGAQGQVDLHVGAQVRIGPARGGLGSVAGRFTSCLTT